VNRLFSECFHHHVKLVRELFVLVPVFTRPLKTHQLHSESSRKRRISLCFCLSKSVISCCSCRRISCTISLFLIFPFFSRVYAKRRNAFSYRTQRMRSCHSLRCKRIDMSTVDQLTATFQSNAAMPP